MKTKGDALIALQGMVLLRKVMAHGVTVYIRRAPAGLRLYAIKNGTVLDISGAVMAAIEVMPRDTLGLIALWASKGLPWPDLFSIDDVSVANAGFIQYQIASRLLERSHHE